MRWIVNSPKKILVVDDEEMLRQAIEYMLIRAGFEVLTAENGTVAFDIVCKTPIDLIISDMRMPGGSGVDLIHKVKNRDPALPMIMFITAFSDITTEEAFDLGATGILSKPFSRDSLVAQVFHCMDNMMGAPTTPPLLKLEGSIEIDQLGRRGFNFIHQGTCDLPINAVCEFKLNTSLSTVAFEGMGIVRWIQSYGPRTCQLGVEILNLKKDSRNYFEKWKKEKNPIPHIPLPRK